ncbi:hypothetical protein M413DRAFT_24768 [Hebeloma cylindrosporum]|uniref:F-box domain-containing protein n=1 Tax=Hebeloma cylindrosporum TaxID=76867 RepID=A0A0C3CPC3_HEBCY|nr:hypothetical protein M413DRAFT_24768 [Hebeloma cylindrosporum h7]
MNTMNVRPESPRTSELPSELEREIFEIAASSHPKWIPKLVLVARRVRIWLEPELYRIMRSGKGRVIPPLYTGEKEGDNDVLDLNRLQQYGRHVKHILLQKRPSQEIGHILNCCPNVHNLALWMIRGSCTHLIPILEGLPLRRLSFDPSYFFQNYAKDSSVPFDQALFHNITHLEVLNATVAWSKWKQLAHLPRLTHLALVGVVNQALIDCVLAECRNLELFVTFFMYTDHPGGDILVPQKDPRVVFLKKIIGHLDHWEVGARGEEDFWIKGERCKKKAMRKDFTNVASTRLSLPISL